MKMTMEKKVNGNIRLMRRKLRNCDALKSNLAHEDDDIRDLGFFGQKVVLEG